MNFLLQKLALQTIGLLSEGISLGWRTGFDSGLMLEYIYENRPRGFSPLGAWIDSIYLAHPVWNEVRARRECLIEQLKAATKQYDQPQIFDLAAGMGSYLFFVPPNAAKIIAGDYEEEVIERGSIKVLEKKRSDITFKKSDAFSFEGLACQKADLLVTSGFFDILLTEEKIKQVLANGTRCTTQGARWVFTIMEHHPELQRLKETMVDLDHRPWEMVPRPASQFLAWASELGWSCEKLERNSCFAIGTMIRER